MVLIGKNWYCREAQAFLENSGLMSSDICVILVIIAISSAHNMSESFDIMFLALDGPALAAFVKDTLLS